MKDPRCPFLNKPCIGQDCVMWTHVTMTNPQSGATEDKWACAIAILPMLTLEGARQGRGTQAAVESMRNEVVTRQETLNNLISQAARRTQHIREVDVPEGPEKPTITG